MGLMYIFPVELDDHDRTEVTIDPNGTQTLILKTYGLPMIFWGYLAAALGVLAIMWLASQSAISKLIAYRDDPGLVYLGHLVQYTLLLIPVVLLAFFFYEKHLIKSGRSITLLYKVFFIPLFSKKIILDEGDALSVDHFMDSPNMAKIYNKTELKAFENRGYFELHGIEGGKVKLIDRHSRKADLIKLKELLNNF